MIAAYIIPYILLVSTILIFRKCLMFFNWRKKEVVVPRIVTWGSLILSLIPFVGYLMFFILVPAFLIPHDVKVRKNRFTDYWFN